MVTREQIQPSGYVGVYSFPKSGNTWLSGIMSYLFFGGDLDAVPSVYIERSDTAPVVETNGECWSFYRSHSKTLWRGPANSSSSRRIVFYLRRHPLDVFLSSLNWLGNVEQMNKYFIAAQPRSVEEIISRGELAHYFGAFLCHMTLQPEFEDAGRLDFNVIQWMQFRDERVNVHHIKYEDLVTDPIGSLIGPLSAFGVSEGRLSDALSHFDDRFPKDGKFFWRKDSLGYLDMLPANMISQFYELYGEFLEFAGYK